MRYQLFVAKYTALALKDRAVRSITDTKKKVVEHKSEIKCIAATSVVVGLTARAAGFQAGYEFAQNS